MSDKSMENNKITNGVIWKQMLIYVVPIAAGTLFQQLYNTVDAIIVGRVVGKMALASVGGSASVLTNMLINFFTGLTSGAGVIVAQSFGAKDKEKLHVGLHTAVAFSFLISIAITIVGWIATPKLLVLMKTPEEIMHDSTVYMRIYLLGITAILIYNMGAAMIRSIGDSKRPLYFLVATSALNIILDVVFVIVLRMGIAGAAIATLISQIFSAILVCYALMTAYDSLKLRWRELRIHGKTLVEELRIGLPTALQFCIFGVTNMMLQAAINNLGTDTMAAWAVFGKIDMVFWAVSGAFGVAITTFAGQNYGAKNLDRVFRSVRTGLLLCGILGGAVLVSLVVFCRPIYLLFTSEETVIQIGIQITRILIPCYTMGIIMDMPKAALRGLGDVKVPTLLTIGGTLLVRLPWIIFVTPVHPQLFFVMFSFPLAWGLDVFCLYPYYFYKKRKLVQEAKMEQNHVEMA